MKTRKTESVGLCKQLEEIGIFPTWDGANGLIILFVFASHDLNNTMVMDTASRTFPIRTPQGMWLGRDGHQPKLAGGPANLDDWVVP